jgi:hypothetical protein
MQRFDPALSPPALEAQEDIMNIGFKDQFNLPGEMQNKISNDIKIVSYGGEIQDPKRIGSRGIMSRGKPPLG